MRATGKHSPSRKQARRLREALLNGTAPIMLDEFDVCSILDLTAQQLRSLIKKGVLVDHCWAGDCAVLRARDVRAELMRRTGLYRLGKSKTKPNKINGLQTTPAAETRQESPKAPSGYPDSHPLLRVALAAPLSHDEHD